MYVTELDLFVTVKSFSKIRQQFSGQGYSYDETSGQLPHLIKDGKKIQYHAEKCVLLVVLGFIDWPVRCAPRKMIFEELSQFVPDNSISETTDSAVRTDLKTGWYSRSSSWDER